MRKLKFKDKQNIKDIYDSLKPFFDSKIISINLFRHDGAIEFLDKYSVDPQISTPFVFRSIYLVNILGMSKLLEKNFGFDSLLNEYIEKYELLLNIKGLIRYNSYYNLNENKNIEKVYKFSFFESNYETSYIYERKFDNLLSQKKFIFEYFRDMFMSKNLPEELIKPVEDLTKDEINLIRMIII